MPSKVLRRERKDHRIADTLKEEQAVQARHSRCSVSQRDADAECGAADCKEGEDERRVDKVEDANADETADGECCRVQG